MRRDRTNTVGILTKDVHTKTKLDGCEIIRKVTPAPAIRAARVSAGEAAVPRSARMVLQSMRARTPRYCAVTGKRLFLVKVQSAMQLFKLFVQLLVILRVPNEMQSGRFRWSLRQDTRTKKFLPERCTSHWISTPQRMESQGHKPVERRGYR